LTKYLNIKEVCAKIILKNLGGEPKRGKNNSFRLLSKATAKSELFEKTVTGGKDMGSSNIFQYGA
jgi:hypothetical protein